MAKSKKNKAKKPSVKVEDMAPEQNPSGGALNTYAPSDTSLKLGTTTPTTTTIQPTIGTTFLKL